LTAKTSDVFEEIRGSKGSGLFPISRKRVRFVR